MLEFISDFLTFPWWVVSNSFIYMFGIIIYWSIGAYVWYYRDEIIDYWKPKPKKNKTHDYYDDDDYMGV